MGVIIPILLAALLAAIIFLLFALMFSYYFLLKRILKLHPKYFRTLGLPFLPTANRSIIKTIKRDKYNYRLLGKLLRGIPGDLPNETRIRRLAAQVRFEMYAIVLLSLVGVGLGFAG